MAEDENAQESTAASASGKKSSSRKSTSSRTSSARKSSARKTSSRKTSAQESSGGSDAGSGNDAPRAEASRKKMSASRIASAAARQLLELTGREVEGVTGLERTEDGWTVRVEVVEVRRIPDTTDVLALYEVEVDEDGDLTGYQRVRRYSRGVPGED